LETILFYNNVIMDLMSKKIVQAAKAGGEMLKKYFGQDLKLKEKTTIADFVSKADLESEAKILKYLSQSFPSYNLHSEERGIINKGSEYTLVIDPLDGSNNFILGLTNFSVAISLLQNKEVIRSVTYLPMSGQVYWAVEGGGAYSGNRRLRVNKQTDIKRSTVAYVGSYGDWNKNLAGFLVKSGQKQTKRVVNNWSPAIDFSLLAAGKLEVVINRGNEIYDYLGGKLMVREAGGKITDFNSRATSDLAPQFVASNGTKLHQEILKLL